MRRQESELTVITRAKELCIYILSVTDKSPKKFRFTLVSRLQNYALDIVEELYMANAIIINQKAGEKELLERKEHQHKAMTRYLRHKDYYMHGNRATSKEVISKNRDMVI